MTPLRHKLLALFAALAAHAGVLLLLGDSAPPGAQAVGLGGIEVSLGPAGGAPGGEAASEAEVPEAEAVESVEAAPVEAIEPVETATAPESVEPIAPETAERTAPPEHMPVETVQTEAAEMVPEIPEVSTRPVAEAPPPPRAKPSPPSKKPDATQTTERAAPKAPPQMASLPPGIGKSGSLDREGAGSGDASQGGGAPGPKADYMALLQAWIEKHKEYPRRAQLRRQEGTVLLRFTMDRKGKLLSYRIERGSGHAALDQEVERMIERAAPLPAIPPEMQQAQIELVLPVSFFLR